MHGCGGARMGGPWELSRLGREWWAFFPAVDCHWLLLQGGGVTLGRVVSFGSYYEGLRDESVGDTRALGEGSAGSPGGPHSICKAPELSHSARFWSMVLLLCECLVQSLARHGISPTPVREWTSAVCVPRLPGLPPGPPWVQH